MCMTVREAAEELQATLTGTVDPFTVLRLMRHLAAFEECASVDAWVIQAMCVLEGEEEEDEEPECQAQGGW